MCLCPKKSTFYETLVFWAISEMLALFCINYPNIVPPNIVFMSLYLDRKWISGSESFSHFLRTKGTQSRDSTQFQMQL
jgi:hypothetical protein